MTALELENGKNKKTIPLDLITQIALRSFFATKFYVTLSGDFNMFRRNKQKPKEPIVEYEAFDPLSA